MFILQFSWCRDTIKQTKDECSSKRIVNYHKTIVVKFPYTLMNHRSHIVTGTQKRFKSVAVISNDFLVKFFCFLLNCLNYNSKYTTISVLNISWWLFLSAVTAVMMYMMESPCTWWKFWWLPLLWEPTLNNLSIC